MEPTKDALENLKQLQKDLLEQKEEIDRSLLQVEGAIYALEGSPKNKSITSDRIDYLMQQGYKTKWTIADKLIFLLKTYGPMTVREIMEKAKIHEGEEYDEKRFLDRFTFQTHTMKRAGLINAKNIGQRNIYSLKPH